MPATTCLGTLSELARDVFRWVWPTSQTPPGIKGFSKTSDHGVTRACLHLLSHQAGDQGRRWTRMAGQSCSLDRGLCTQALASLSPLQ